MDQSLTYFLIGCLVWAALLYYIFIVRQASDPGFGGKSALVVVSVLVIPILGLALWNQHQSYGRLEQLGFTVFEGLGSSVGVAAGNGSSPTWLYSLSASESDVLDFYRQPENHKGWKLTSENSNSLVFRRGASKMRLQISNGSAVFLFFDVGELKPNQ